MPHEQQRLEQTDRAGCATGVTHQGLGGTDGGDDVAKECVEGPELNVVADGCAGTVGLHIIDAVVLESSVGA